jgi:hypothetical protein
MEDVDGRGSGDGDRSGDVDADEDADRSEDAEAAGVAVTRMETREGGWVGYTDDAVFVEEGGDRRIRIDHSNVTRVSLTTVEWDLAVLSLLLVGVGTYVAATRNTLVGVGFGAVGVWSCYRTYNQRHELRIHVEGRHEPVTLHPVEPAECHDTLAEVVGLERRGGPA